MLAECRSLVETDKIFSLNRQVAVNGVGQGTQDLLEHVLDCGDIGTIPEPAGCEYFDKASTSPCVSEPSGLCDEELLATPSEVNASVQN